MNELLAPLDVLCELCIEQGGRFNANRDCCQIRLLAGAPRHSRELVFARVKNESGALQVAALMKKVAAEYKRLNANRLTVGLAALADIREKISKAAGHGKSLSQRPF